MDKMEAIAMAIRNAVFNKPASEFCDACVANLTS